MEIDEYNTYNVESNLSDNIEDGETEANVSTVNKNLESAKGFQNA